MKIDQSQLKTELEVRVEALEKIIRESQEAIEKNTDAITIFKNMLNAIDKLLQKSKYKKF